MKFPAKLLIVIVVLMGSSSLVAVQAQASKPNPGPQWKQNVSIGLTLTSGNADTSLLTGNYAGSTKWGSNEIALGLNGGYGESEHVANNKYVNGFGQYNWLLGGMQRLYGFGRLGAQYDGIAAIDYRITLAGGLGYYLLKEGVDGNKRFNLSTEVGPGYVVEQVGGRNDDYATLYGAEKFTWKINDRSNLWQSLNFTPQMQELRSSETDSEVGLSTKVTAAMDLRIVLDDTYRTEPAAGLKHNDLKLVTGLGYSF